MASGVESGTKRVRKRVSAKDQIEQLHQVYSTALNAIVESQRAQNAMIAQWFEMFKVNTEPQKGWINDERTQFINEMIEEKGDSFFPQEFSHEQKAEWLENTLTDHGI